MRRLGPHQGRARWILILSSLFLISSAATAQLSISVPSVSFGNVQVSSTRIVPVGVANTGKSKITISRDTVSGTGFGFAGPNLPITLWPKQTASLSVSFAPQAAGSASGSLTISYRAFWGGYSFGHFGTGTVALSGTGYTASTPGVLGAPSSMNLGSVPLGSSQTQALTLSNSGGSSLTISAATVSGSGFTASGLTFPYTLAPGSSASLSVVFSPTAAGTDNATLSLSSNASNSLVNVSLTGSGTTTTGTLGVTPGSMSFGSVTIGSTQTQNGSVTASGGNVTLSSANSSNSVFSFGGLTLPVTLAAGQSVPFTVTFKPTATGTISANISFSSNASDSLVNESLTGSGTATSGTLGVLPGSLNFGSVTIGSPQTQNGSVTASGGSVTLSSASSSNSAFSLGGLTLPVTLAAGQSAPFSVTFNPTAAGTVSANISFFTTTSGSASQGVSGTGATIPHIVNLSWSPSTSTSVAGYNVYRGTAAAGPYSRINPALNGSFNYSDSSVQSGKTYYYVTTAVDAAGVESSYSNQVQAVVPFP